MTERAKSIKNYGIFILFRPICLVIYRKSEKGESMTNPLTLLSWLLAVILYLELSAKLIE